MLVVILHRRRMGGGSDWGKNIESGSRELSALILHELVYTIDLMKKNNCLLVHVSCYLIL